MNSKQIIIIIELVLGLILLILAVNPVFGGKTGIQVVAGYISNNINDAIAK